MPARRPRARLPGMTGRARGRDDRTCRGEAGCETSWTRSRSGGIRARCSAWPRWCVPSAARPASQARPWRSPPRVRSLAACPAAASRGPSTSWPARSARPGSRCWRPTGSATTTRSRSGLTCGGILDICWSSRSAARVFPELGEVVGGHRGGRAGRRGQRDRGPRPGRRAPGDLGRARAGQRQPRQRGAAGRGRGRRRARDAGPGPDRRPALRRGRRAARGRAGRVRALVRAAAPDAGLRRHRLRRRRGPGREVPRLPGDRVRRPGHLRDARPVSPRPTRWWSSGRTASWPGRRWTRAR